MYVLGIDVGTTGTKAILLDEEGRVAGQGYQGYPTLRKDGGIVEQDAEEWWLALQSAVHQACDPKTAAGVKGISLSTQGGSSLLVDKNGRPLGNAITWMDTRALPQKQILEQEKGSEWFYSKTGWPLNASLDACKALWVVEDTPQLLAQAKWYISTLEFINLKLTGAPVIDPTTAAMRQLMDIHTHNWDDEIVNATRLNANLLPPILPSGECIGTLTANAAKVLGLPQTVQVFNGAHDQYCCALGSGSVNPNDTFLGTGTAWALMSNTQKPLFTPA
ncbi:MAG: xylulokinase, partial [Oscillospiraceae bacterium]